MPLPGKAFIFNGGSLLFVPQLFNISAPDCEGMHYWPQWQDSTRDLSIA